MKWNFPECLDHLLRYEGGYVNHKRDPGGETNLGISKRSYPNEDIKGMTRARAATIYKRDFWDRVRGDDLPAGVDLVVFDPAVNSGPSRGVRWLQQALGVSADGRMGPITVKQAKAANAEATIKKACSNRMGFLRGLGTWDTFGRGWSARVASVEATGVKMAGGDMKSNQQGASADANAGAGGAGAAGAGGSWGLLDGSDPILVVMSIAVIALGIVLFYRSRHDRNRAKAYKENM